MKLDYREQRKVKIDMTDYLLKILDNLPDKYQCRAITPAANHIFGVNETARKLSEKYTQEFYTIVAKFIFLCKRLRSDILTRVAYPTTRVREPGEDDDKKLSHMLKYISGTRDLLLTMESGGTVTVKW